MADIQVSSGLYEVKLTPTPNTLTHTRTTHTHTHTHPSPPPRIHHQRSRYVYDLFYKRKAISRGESRWPLSLLEVSLFYLSLSLSLYAVSMPHPSELYDYCLNEGYADKNLIAKWKKVLSIAIALPEPTTDARHIVCVY